jgi:hypothetical protein
MLMARETSRTDIWVGKLTGLVYADFVCTQLAGDSAGVGVGVEHFVLEEMDS